MCARKRIFGTSRLPQQKSNKARMPRGVWVFLFLIVLASSGFAADNQAGSSTSSTSLDFANGLYARRMYAPAVAEYEKFLKTNPTSTEAASARFRYADSYYFTKDYASAIAHFELFLKEFPGDKRVPMAQFRLGTARYYRGDTARAIRIFRKLSKTSEARPSRPQRSVAISGITTEARPSRPQRSVAISGITTDESVVKSGSVFYLAKCLENKGKTDRSLRILEQLARSDKQSEYASYAGVAVGDFYLKGGRYPKAVNGYRIAADNGNPPELARQARFKTAEILFSLKNYSEAAIYYQKVFDEPVQEEALPDAQKKNRESLKGKSLLGLFYCDYNKQDLEAAERRFSLQQPTIAASAYQSDIVFLIANLLEEKGRHDQALAKLEEVLADTETESSLKEKAQFKKITVLSAKGQKDESLKELEKFFGGTGQNNERALFEKAQILAAIGKTDEALLNYQKIISDFPGSDTAKTALFQIALTEFKAVRMDSARGNFKKYSERYPNDSSSDLALLQMVQIDLDGKNFKQAFEGAEAFLKNHEKSEYLDIGYYKLGVAATGLKHFNHAAYAFNKILEKFPDSKLYAESLYGAAISLENGNRIAQALPLYEKLLETYPEHTLSQEVWTRLGYLYIQNNNVDKANVFYQDLIFNRPQVRFDPDGVFWLIQYSLDHGDYTSLDKILAAFPARFPEKNMKHEILFFKGESAMGMKDYAKAVEFYSQAIQEKPEGAFVAQAHLGLGIAHSAMDDASAAEKDFNQALAYDHELKVAMRARFELANLLLKAKDLEGAAKAFMLVAILYDDPKYTPPALYKAGECFRSIQRMDESQKAFVELKTRYPESDWARKAG